MPDRAEIIDHLKVIWTYAATYSIRDVDCPKIAHYVDDAIRVLEAQEPRVMTLEEALGAEVNVDQCWLEVKGIKQIYLADAVVCPEHVERADIQRWGASDCQLPLNLYGDVLAHVDVEADAGAEGGGEVGCLM